MFPLATLDPHHGAARGFDSSQTHQVSEQLSLQQRALRSHEAEPLKRGQC